MRDRAHHVERQRIECFRTIEREKADAILDRGLDVCGHGCKSGGGKRKTPILSANGARGEPALRRRARQAQENGMKKGALNAPLIAVAELLGTRTELWSSGDRRFRQVFYCFVLVVLHLRFVFDDLPVQLVDQCIDGCIQVMRDAFHVNILAS